MEIDMKIRLELLQSVIDEYIDEVFNGFKQDLANMINRVGAKMRVTQAIEDYGKVIADEQGIVNVDRLEKYVMPEVRKLGIIEINGVGKKFSFNEGDVMKLFSKIKEKSTND